MLTLDSNVSRENCARVHRGVGPGWAIKFLIVLSACIVCMYLFNNNYIANCIEEQLWPNYCELNHRSS